MKQASSPYKRLSRRAAELAGRDVHCGESSLENPHTAETNRHGYSLLAVAEMNIEKSKFTKIFHVTRTILVVE